MVLTSISDFVIPVLQVLNSLGGKAWLSDIEDEFYKRFHNSLDPTKDWQQITGNHGKTLWQDYCGSRVAFHYLKPCGYISIERHGKRGSVWEITRLGQERLLTKSLDKSS